jgi:Uma2 family endonuclease
MIAPPHEKLVTGEELYHTPNSELTELMDGRIVPMEPTGPEHGTIEASLAETMGSYARQNRLGLVQVGEVGIYIRRNPDRVRAADVLFISLERYAQRQSKRGYLDVAPELVVEILSPDDSMMEMTQKLRDYFSIGVRLIWVVDPEARSVFAYRSLTDVREFTEQDTLTGDEVLQGFTVPVARLFEM